jgi:hypothetical protein
MGDRYTVGFTGFEESDNEERRVWLYSHWGGNDRYAEISRAIKAAHLRWEDPTYATRIAISHIVADQWQSEYGFGIEAGPYCLTHVEYNPILVDWNECTVSEFMQGDGQELGPCVNKWDFDAFVWEHTKTKIGADNGR